MECIHTGFVFHLSRAVKKQFNAVEKFRQIDAPGEITLKKFKAFDARRSGWLARQDPDPMARSHQRRG